jgi:hypothetical protein
MEQVLAFDKDVNHLPEVLPTQTEAKGRQQAVAEPLSDVIKSIVHAEMVSEAAETLADSTEADLLEFESN